jgi:hypothetical protein
MPLVISNWWQYSPLGMTFNCAGFVSTLITLQGLWMSSPPFLASFSLDHVMELDRADFDVNKAVMLPDARKLIIAGMTPHPSSACSINVHIFPSRCFCRSPVLLFLSSRSVADVRPAVNASLATRIHATPAVGPADGTEDQWRADMDHAIRYYKQDRSPSTPSDRVTCIQFVSTIGIVTAFLVRLFACL